MITRIGFAPRKPGLGSDEFQTAWFERHGPLAARIPGLTRYWQNHAVLRDGECLLAWPGFDACSELSFPDVDTMNRGFAAEEYQSAVRRDEELLVDKARGGLIVAECIEGRGAIDVPGVRHLTFMRLASAHRLATLGKSLREVPTATSGTGSAIYLALDPRPAQPSSAFDALLVQCFDGAEAAESYNRSTEAREHRTVTAGLVHGVERLIARARVIL